jgi:uncharacterized delta-60 repeat protein
MDADSSNNVYHTIGAGRESENRHGKIELSWAAEPVRSLVISFWATTDTETVGGSQLPRFDGQLKTASITASLSNITFRRGAPLPGKVWAIVEQPDGRILIGGHFTDINGVDRKNIARLNADGTLDPTFDAGTGPNGDVHSLDVQADGSILAGGDFTTWNGTSAGARIVLLTSSGARNTGWTSPVSVNSGDIVKWIESTPAGVYVGGKFNAPRNGLARLNSGTGANDATFNPGSAAGSASVNAGLVLDDGKILVGGDFTSFSGSTRNRVARLSAAGALDAGFAPSPGFDAMVNALMRLPGAGYAHAGGAFGAYNGATRAKVTVFNAGDGSAGTAVWGPSGMTMNAVYDIK